jgi:hypothetical protein
MYKLYIHFPSILVASYTNFTSMIYSNSKQKAPQEPNIVINYYSQSVVGMNEK